MLQVLLPFPSQADFVVCFARDRSWKTLVQLQRNSTTDEVFSVQCLSGVVTLGICSLKQTSITEQTTFGQYMRVIEVKPEMDLSLR